MYPLFSIRRQTILFFLFSLPLAGQAAEENNTWQFTPELSFAFRNFEYSAATTDIDGDIFSLRLGVSVAHDSYYLDITGETNLNSGDTNLADTNFDRRDATFTFGYGLSETISAFAGYKHGETTIKGDENTPGSKIILTGNGFFAGAGGVWPVKNIGAFSFSAAFAVMDASYDQSPVIEKVSGDATGTSLALSWNGVLQKKFLYHLTLQRHDYFYEDFGETLTFDISENVLSFSAGISYRF